MGPVQDWDLLVREIDQGKIPCLRLPLATDSDLAHLPLPVAGYVRAVKDGRFPAPEHSYA